MEGTATVSTALKIYDQFTQPLQRIAGRVNTAVTAMERLRRQMEAPVTMNINAGNALSQIGQIQQRISRVGTGAINILVNADDVKRRIDEIQKQIKQKFSQALVRVAFDGREAVRQAGAIRSQIESQLRGIRAKIRVDLPVHLEAFFANLNQMILRLIRVTRQLNTNIQSGDTRQLQSALQRVAQLEERINQQQEQFNRRLRKGGNASNGLLTNIKGLAAAYLSFAGVQKLLGATIGRNMEQQKMSDMFIARTGSVEVGTAMFQKFKADALAAGQDVNKSLQASLSFFSTTQNAGQLTQLNNLAQRLNAFDSAGNGIEGAAFALKEAMSGDIVSLAERFNMSKSDIRAFKIDELGKKGDMDGFIKAFDQLLEKQRMGQKAFETMMKSPVKQTEILGNNLRSAFADAGGAAVKGLLPLIVMFNTAFQAGKFQPFFDMLSQGLSLGAQGLTYIIHAAQWLFRLIDAYGPEISAMLLTWGVAYIPTLITKLWGMVKPIYAQVPAWLAIHWPLLLIVAAVGLVVFALRQFGVTTDQIVGFVIGIFYTLFALLYNSIAYTWNYLLAFAEFLGNIFIDPVYAIQKLFYDLIKNVVDYFGNLINSIIDGLNWVIGKINSVSGKNIKLIGELDTSAIDRFKPTTNKDVFDLSKYKMSQKDLGKAFQSGYSTGAGWLDKTTKAAESFNLDALTNGEANINRVNEVGKINDTVDISNEDLKLMRDLAELKNIQNFVTLTPTVQVTTGDIHQEMDVRKLIRQIEEAMEREIQNSARGVYQ
ncbi:hypothetical protein [Desulforamulus ruminis]|uniref:hypothetical protein n=1 Tax=Desulforamulus ruminis TaxID=1564 RepID=UPI002352D5AC|nr:hypothetical protein [Desulforamulus ruminis]